jgi:hypothetical protein
MSVAFAAMDDYLAIGSNRQLLETFLVAPATDATSLKLRQGLQVAAQKVGGFDTGMFTYTNDRESLRRSYEDIRAGTAADSSLRTAGQFLSALGMSRNLDAAGGWFDPTLLPPYAGVEKYFHFSVTSGRMDADGFTMMFFAPRPPEL